MDEEDGAATSVRRWLSGQGFPLEMRVARAFDRGLGLEVTSSDYFTDPDTQRSREIDVVVQRHVAIDTLLAAVVCAVVECKTAAKDQQWVGFENGRRVPALLAAKERPASLTGRRWLELMQVGLNDGSIAAPLLFGEYPEVHGITTTWQSGREEERDAAYRAVQGSARAAHARVAGWDETIEARSANSNRIVGVALPVVVFAGDLFVTRLAGESDEIEVHRVQRLKVVLRASLGRSHYTVVDVVTEQGLPTLVDELAKTANAFVDEGVGAAREADGEFGAPQAW